jgi:hypothetical protein
LTHVGIKKRPQQLLGHIIRLYIQTNAVLLLIVKVLVVETKLIIGLWFEAARAALLIAIIEIVILKAILPKIRSFLIIKIVIVVALKGEFIGRVRKRRVVADTARERRRQS